VTDVERLYAYALTVTGDIGIASEAVHDALVVAAVRSAQWSDGDPWPRTVGLTRNECFRQLRARNRFVDTADAIAITETDAMAALTPGERDALALSLRTDLSADEMAQVMGVSTQAMQTRVSQAQQAWRDSVQVLVSTTVRPAPCPGLESILAACDHEGYLWPRQRRQIVAHVKACTRCRQASSAAVAQGVAGLEVDQELTPPVAIDERVAATLEEGDRATTLAERAGTFSAEGFPQPLETNDYATTPWLKRAVIAAAASTVFLLLALAVFGLAART
jgi:DNA-directed RNA polymerase specialized sigma24 family protein